MLRRSAQAAIKKIEAAAARKTPLVTEGAAREQNPPATPSGISGNPMTGNPSSEVIL
jgi:hypothetical protein